MTKLEMNFKLLESGLYRKVSGFIPKRTWGGCFKRDLIVKVDDEWLYTKECIAFLKSVESFSVKLSKSVTAKQVVQTAKAAAQPFDGMTRSELEALYALLSKALGK